MKKIKYKINKMFDCIKELYKKVFKNKIKSNSSDNFKLHLKLCLITSLLTFLTFCFPSFVYNLIIFLHRGSFVLHLKPSFIGMFLPLAVIMSLARYKITIFILSLFIFMELIQFGNIFYFGTPLNPFMIELMATEISEILESGLAMNFIFFLFPLIVIIPYGFLIYFYKKVNDRRKQFLTIPLIVVLLIFSYFPRRIIKNREAKATVLPDFTDYSLYNDLKTFSLFLFDRIPALLKNKDQSLVKKYLDYDIVLQDKITSPINIIVIWGESVNGNHFSLLGYDRNTNPLLTEIQKNDKNFTIIKALSSGVMTTVSTNMFFNVRREPDNKVLFFKRTANLFDLAKNNGFNTFYITAQNSLLKQLTTENIDNVITKSNDLSSFKQDKELFLIEMLKKYKKKMGDKNFIVLHKRGIHSPYADNYKNNKSFIPKFDIDSIKSIRYNEYDNAVLYEDYVISEFLKYLKTFSKNPTYIFYVPDHGELIDENGKYGHGHLELSCALIPFILTFYNTDDDKIKNKINSMYIATHYEIAKLVANKLGYEIINPNENDNTFYINGTDLFGETGFIKFKRETNKINILNK